MLHGPLDWIQFIHHLVLLPTPKSLQPLLTLVTAITAKKVMKEIMISSVKHLYVNEQTF